MRRLLKLLAQSLIFKWKTPAQNSISGKYIWSICRNLVQFLDTWYPNGRPSLKDHCTKLFDSFIFKVISFFIAKYILPERPRHLSSADQSTKKPLSCIMWFAQQCNSLTFFNLTISKGNKRDESADRKANAHILFATLVYATNWCGKIFSFKYTVNAYKHQ